jgi:hypothetical protein
MIGLALGIEQGALGMNKHFISPAPFFKQWETNIIAAKEAKEKAEAEAKAKAEAAAAKAAAAKAKSEAGAKEGEA